MPEFKKEGNKLWQKDVERCKRLSLSDVCTMRIFSLRNKTTSSRTKISKDLEEPEKLSDTSAKIVAEDTASKNKIHTISIPSQEKTVYKKGNMTL